MARERQTQSSSSAGLLSGVFSFVSKEIESFVTTATGGEVQNHDHRKPSSSNGMVGNEVRAPMTDREEECRDRQRRSKSSSRRARSRDHTEKHYYQRTPSPGLPPVPQLYPSLQQRRQSISMPGSLFPRSPSLLPDSPPHCVDDGDERHVRFAYENEKEAGPSRPRDIPRSKTSAASGSHSSPVSASPLSRRGVSSVKDAVRRFRVGEEDAGASILLPRETVSPGKGKGKEKVRDEEYPPTSASRSSSLRDKGKQRAREEVEVEPEFVYDYVHSAEMSGDVRVRGKERELVEAKEEQTRKQRRRQQRECDRSREKEGERDSAVEEEVERERGRDKERIRILEEEIRMLKEELLKRPINTAPLPAPPAPPPPLPPGSTLTTRTRSNSNSNTSTDALFATARAALKRTSQPVELPINFGGLGARVKRTGQPTVNIAGEKMAAFLSEMKSVRLRKVGGAGAGGGNASGGNTGDREGDMGTSVNGLTRSWSAGSRPAALDANRQSTMEASSSLTRHGLPSFRSLGNRTEDSRIGEKRKRYGETEAPDGIQNAAKRRVVSSSFASTSTIPDISTSNSSSCVNLPSSSSSSSFPQRPNARSNASNRTWPSAATETDLTTPELCSDNENEREREGEGDSSLDGRYRLPSTPPLLKGGAKTGKGKQRVDVDVDMDVDARVPQAGSPRIRRESELFSKRLPTSPMLLDTPRKPRPPARPLGRATPKSTSKLKSKSHQDEDEDDDPLSLSFSSPDMVVLSSVRPKEVPTAKGNGKKKKRSTPSREAPRESEDPAFVSSAQNGLDNMSRRRLTLDQEIRDARARSLLRDDEDLQLQDDLDSGILVSVGTRSKKRGFLAHGGAGGLPVFIGEGYVDGAEGSDYEDDEPDDMSGDDDGDDYEPSRKQGAAGRGRKRPSTAVVKRKNRR